MRPLPFCVALALLACPPSGACADDLRPRDYGERSFSTANGLASLYTPQVPLEDKSDFDYRIQRFIRYVESHADEFNDTSSARGLMIWSASRSETYSPALATEIVSIATEGAGIATRYLVIAAFLENESVGDPKTYPRTTRQINPDWSEGKVTGNYGAGAIYQSQRVSPIVFHAANDVYQSFTDSRRAIRAYKDGSCSLADCLASIARKHLPFPQDDAPGRQQVDAGFLWGKVTERQRAIQRVVEISSGRSGKDKAPAQQRKSQGNGVGKGASGPHQGGGRWERPDRPNKSGGTKYNELDFSDDPFVVDLNEPPPKK